MKAEELLPVKKLRSVLPIKARLSTTIQSGSSRSKLVIATEAFNQFYNPGRDGINPRSDTYGSASEGLIFLMNSSGGNKVDLATKSSVYFNFNVRPINGAENRVSVHEIDAVIATYEDGTKALLVGPLPNPFLKTSDSKTRETSMSYRPLRAIEIAFEAAKLKPLYQSRLTASGTLTGLASVVNGPSPAVAEDIKPIESSPKTVVDAIAGKAEATSAPATAIETHEQVATGTARAPELFDKFKSGIAGLADIGEMLQMLNAEAERFHETGGGTVKFRIDEDGKIRASADVRATIDL